MSTIETTLTNFKNFEAIALLNEMALPSILLSCVSSNNIEFFDELLKFDKTNKANLLLKSNDEGQNVFHMIGFNNNSEYVFDKILKRK